MSPSLPDPRSRPLLAVLAVLALAAAAAPDRDRELVTAVENGDLTAVEEALQAGADAGARTTPAADRTSPTVLMLAAAADRADIVAALLAAGADPEAEDAAGTTAVMWAVTRRANDALAVLVHAGADVRRFPGSPGETPLLAALTHHNEDAVALLIEGGADVDARGGESRQTALMLAAEHGYPWAARWLLDAGADVDARRADDGRTALDVAVERGHTQLVALLEARGAHRSSTAVPPPPPAFLPPAELDRLTGSSATELSADASSWSHLVLQRMGEPGLCERSAEPDRGTPDRGTPDPGESFRFLWVRTFDEPLMVKIEGRADGSAVLTAAILDGQGGYEFDLPGRRVTRVVKARRWRAFRELAEEASFWQLPSADQPLDTIVLDGASWALEGKRNGGCHVVWRTSPEPGGPWADFRRLCRTLLDLARLGSQARPVY